MARAFGWAKIVGVVCLLAVLGAGAALVAIKAFLPEPKLRAMIVDAARKQLGREVKLAGVSAGLTGLRLSGLEISERPDFAAGTFVAVESFSVRPSWRALLRKKLVVASASADGLSLRIVKDAGGAFNYETLASSAPAAPAAKPSADAGPAPEFNVRHLRVRRGAIEYADLSTGEKWTVSDLALSVDGFGLSEPFGLDLSLRAKGKAGERPVDAALTFNGVVNPARGDRAKFSADFKRLIVEQDGLKLSAKGKVAGLSAVTAELDAELSAAGKTLLEAEGTVSAAAPDEKGRRAVDADLKLKTPGLDTTLLAKWMPSAGVPALSIPAGDAALKAKWRGENATIDSFRVAWAAGKAEGSGKASGLGTAKPVYEGRAEFGLDLPELRPGQYAFLKLPPKSFVPAMRLDGSVAYSADEVRLAPLKAKFKQGTLEASGVVRRLSSAKPVPDLDVKVDLDLPPIKAAELPVTSTAIPAGFVLPAMTVKGGAQAKGDDVVLQKLKITGKSGSLSLDGRIAKALAGEPNPDLEVLADLDLPALTDKDLPVPGVPEGLELPASKWNADLSYTPKAVRLRKLAVVIGSNELSVEGGVSDPAGRGAFDLLLKCRKFVLSELTRVTPKTRDMKLSGDGFFALSVTGTKEKPVFGGKLQFKGLGATVAELPLSDFTGTVSFDERRIDVPNLKGKVADGNLAIDLTVLDYAKTPNVQVEAHLDRFDLGKFLAAQQKVSAERAAAKAAKAARKGEAPPDPNARALRTSGKFEVGELLHSYAQVQKVAVSWDLWGVTPDMKRLTGEAKLLTGTGRLQDVGKLALQSPVVKVLLFPILLIQRLGLGVNLNDIAVRGIIGDYAFKDGLMTLRRSELDAEKAHVNASGTINLPTEDLALEMSAQIGNLPAAEFAVGGTMSAPKSKLKVGKLLENAGKNLLNLIPR